MFTIETSWDDGCIEDFRIADLLRKYELPGIFYIPNQKTTLTEKQIVELSKDFRIGGHTVNHPHDIKLLSNLQIEYEVKENKKTLEQMIGKEVDSFCYPRGRYNDIVKDIVKSAGYKNARTTKVLLTKQPEDLFEMETTIHVYRERVEYNGRNWLELSKELLHNACITDGYFHLWGHGWEVQKQGLWDELEELLSLMYEYNCK